jgi:hypothetical protein
MTLIFVAHVPKIELLGHRVVECLALIDFVKQILCI